jgi:hypothetical protein
MGIRYELREYEVDPGDLAAEAVAAKIGVHQDRFSKHWSLRATVTAFASQSFQGTPNWTSRRSLPLLATVRFISFL